MGYDVQNGNGKNIYHVHELASIFSSLYVRHFIKSKSSLCRVPICKDKAVPPTKTHQEIRLDAFQLRHRFKDLPGMWSQTFHADSLLKWRVAIDFM